MRTSRTRASNGFTLVALSMTLALIGTSAPSPAGARDRPSQPSEKQPGAAGADAKRS